MVSSRHHPGEHTVDLLKRIAAEKLGMILCISEHTNVKTDKSFHCYGYR